MSYIDAIAILNNDNLHVFMVNRGLVEDMTVHIKVADQSVTALDSAEILTGPDPKAMNSFEQPNLIRATPFQAVKIADGIATVTLPPISVAAMTFHLEN